MRFFYKLLILHIILNLTELLNLQFKNKMEIKWNIEEKQ